jgi:UDP-hydrolysing UDP-N-acetyl-D-glucosamine 2-epimerase
VTRTIGIVTGTRAEYGLLKALIGAVHEADDLELQLVVTGMHLAPEFGATVCEIERDGFPIAERVEMLLSSDSAIGVAKSTGLGLIGFAETFGRLRPDIVVLLGDRFEMLAAASAALFLGIPLAHIHGGEVTEGAFDEAIRHSITKMSQLHFVAEERYRRRVIQLGETPDRVFTVGALGADAIRNLDLLDRAALEATLNIALPPRIVLVTYHPPTLDGPDAVRQMHALLEALDALGDDFGIVFTMPNADTRGRELGRMVREFANRHPRAWAYDSLGQLRYLSLMALADAVVGNSSSGIIEAPVLGVPTLNIGDRQAGRLRHETVVDCGTESEAIEAGLAKVLTPDFRRRPVQAGNGEDSTGAIMRQLRAVPLDGILKKRFHDLEF